MADPDVAVRVRGLAKSYVIRHRHEHHVTLAEAALDRLRHPLRRTDREVFWALRDVSFDVRRGEVLGIVGRNGAGKSTLLKILSRITPPTEGRVELFGRVGSLLEVGTGFHPELTGRENVYLNGSILGMRRREIDRQFDEIVAFAGVEQFLDTPVKRYSSGMYVRLAFAVAAHLRSEILIVDEVLAVGDAEFQRKCLGKMHDVAVDGRTVLLVSHQAPTIAALCSDVLVMDRGTVALRGPAREALAHYARLASGSAPELRGRRFGSGEARVSAITAVADTFAPDEPKEFTVEIGPAAAPLRYWVSGQFVDEHGVVVAQCDSRVLGLTLDASAPRSVRLRLISPWLKPARYRLDVYVCANGVVDGIEGAVHFDVRPVLPYPEAATEDAYRNGAVLAQFEAVDLTGDHAVSLRRVATDWS